jgi:alanine racemase
VNSVVEDEAGSVLTIDLGALASNWRKLASLCANAECSAVVKANGYGLGIEAVGKTLDAAGCQTFFVAHPDEGARLRKVAPRARIFVLNGFHPAAAGAYLASGLSAIIGSVEEFAALHDLAANGARIPFALHVDTGMNRLGFDAEDALKLIGMGHFDFLSPVLFMSHFVSSEEPADPINQAQITAFDAIRAAWINRFANNPQKQDTFSFSLSNSSGIFLKEKPFYDLVRPGYALYGGNPCPGQANPMADVVRLESRIIQMRVIPAGMSVGYNAQWVAPRETRIATLSVGYADGILRSLSNKTGEERGGSAIVNGRPCPFAGRVSMDLITIDVTDAGPVKAGDHATIIGDSLTIDSIADRAGTNGYNILTNLGARFARRYVQ